MADAKPLAVGDQITLGAVFVVAGFTESGGARNYLLQAPGADTIWLTAPQLRALGARPVRPKGAPPEDKGR